MRMHTLRNAALALVGVLLITVGVAQTDDASKIQAARAATEPVFELGRYLSDIQTLEEKYPKLALSKEQAKQLLPILQEIKAAKRLTPEVAQKLLPKVQGILTPTQRNQVAQIASQRTPGTEGGAPGANRVQFLNYANGGAFNPLTNSQTTLGQDFARLLAAMEKRIH